MGSSEPARRRAAVIVNPTKFTDFDPVRVQIEEACEVEGWAAPLWLETTVEDTGEGQAREALDAGVDVVCPLGGDGTIRAVAQSLVHSGTPMALLPSGTGNLLARNLGVPHSDLGEALEVALSGRDVPIDVGEVRFDVSGEDQDARWQVFLVMAGFGFDAAMIAGAPEDLKARVGWLAYALSGVRNLDGPRVKVSLSVDGGEWYTRRVHTVLVGNCGRLQGGIELLPDARLDDGWLDAVTLSPKGVVGWATVTARLLTRRTHPRIERMRCRELLVRASGPQEGELDGDTVGPVRSLGVRVDPGALLVRLPVPSRE